MQFLIIGKNKDTATMMSPAVNRQLAEASYAVMSQHKKEGKILEYYTIPAGGSSRIVVISEARSHEELAKNIMEAPANAIMDFEIYPLADFDEMMKFYIERLKVAEQRAADAPK